ncbi:MAG: type II toxin-antitoxin system HicA family toxin [Candidatus ainarchaeum sp.]|nr:type II toxin-antitoxin system HicA family toxin [Candidatus ainarchaeum sp.]
MPKLWNVSAREVVKVSSRLGFVFARQKGSHIILKHNDGRLLVIPNHEKLKIGTLLQIIKALGISREEFEKLL